MPKFHSINVRALAEFSLMKGDLVTPMLDRMNDGVKGHKLLQSQLDEGWKAEEYISRDESIGKICLRVQGRADAVRRSENRIQVMEIKTTSVNPRTIALGDHPEHLAQGEIYAYLLCANEGVAFAEVTLVYYRLDGIENRYRRSYTFDELRERFCSLAKPYADWVEALDEWKELSVPTLETLKFPFPNYRDGQREMAKQVFYAMRDGSRALIEAPTGIGKTAASMFGALKALGKQKITAIFYLTARTTGRRAAEHALEIMRQNGLKLRSITITAKEKCCPMQQTECFGCPLAADYYERRRPALKEALEIEAADAEIIRALAAEYEICPYELSLDMSEQADVIICDYNYAFDPRVYLRRYFDQKSKVGLLVDEAHNLPDRARDMLSIELSGKRIEEIRREVGRFEGRESPTYMALTQLLKVFTRPDAEIEALTAPADEWIQAAQNFADVAGDIQSPEPEVHKLMLDCVWFARTARQMDEAHYRAMVLPQENRIAVRLWCYDPSAHLQKIYKRVGGVALFSATLAPMDHYAQQLGLDANGEDSLLQLDSPFPPENLLTVRLPVSVKFNDRERTLNSVVQIIHTMAEAHPGNYLACFPSFAYLNMVYERYRFYYPDDFVMRQQSGMDEKSRTAFIECFQANPKRSMVAFIVLGGVFAEGVDLPDDRLSGAAIISTGIPQIGFERSLIQELYDDGFGSGYDVAFTYPGIRRVLQAAGRVIRTETDRGVVLLLDMRYGEEKMQMLLPNHWQVEKIGKLTLLQKRLHRFWKEETSIAPDGDFSQ